MPHWSHILSAILVVVVVFILAVSIPSKLYAAVRNVFNSDNNLSVTSKEDLKDAFEELIKRYNNCFSSNKVKCKCDSLGLPKFPKEYTIRIARELVLINDKGSFIKFDDVDTKLKGNTQCYLSDVMVDGEYVSLPFNENPFLSYKKNDPIIITSKDKFSFLDDHFLFKNSKGDVCLIVKEPFEESKKVLFWQKRLDNEVKEYFNTVNKC